METSSNSQAGAAPRSRGRPGLTPEVREQALAAAGELLAEEGLNGMQARTIARRAGLSVGSIYKLFGDIQDLIRELNYQTYQAIADHHQAALTQADLPENAVHDRLMVLARAYIEFVVTQNARWPALLTFNARHGTALPREYREVEDDLLDIIANELAKAPGFEDPEFRARSSRALWAAVHGMITVGLPNARVSDPVAEVVAQIDLVATGMLCQAAQRL
ncbi:MAG: TetR/AcrR family transcriptional regulator [Alphaproteobacteria bacterium]|nr:TetR/AcrR family transcriptional regulator [Alphaproteobacteria bacterium]